MGLDNAGQYKLGWVCSEPGWYTLACSLGVMLGHQSCLEYKCRWLACSWFHSWCFFHKEMVNRDQLALMAVDSLGTDYQWIRPCTGSPHQSQWPSSQHWCRKALVHRRLHQQVLDEVHSLPLSISRVRILACIGKWPFRPAVQCTQCLGRKDWACNQTVRL